MTIIEREEAIKENQDAEGRVWRPSTAPQESLYRLFVVTDEGDLRMPKGYPEGISGQFTNLDRAYKALDAHLRSSWDKAEKTKLKNSRKEYAKDVEAKETAKEES